MKRFTRVATVFLSLAATAAIGLAQPSVTVANVCSDGTGLPPFLSAGADPNLLLLLDNSGSMLDMAYLDDNTQCFDDTYSPDTIIYTGNYEFSSNYLTWYKWTDGSLPTGIESWTSGECYKQDDLVVDGGVLYEATCLTPSCYSYINPSPLDAFDGCPSGGNNVGEDNEDGGVIWKNYIEYEPWQDATSYSVNDFVKYQSHLYRAENTNTSNGTSPIDDTGVSWKPVDHTWIASHGYSTGSIVTFKGMLFMANQSFTSSATGLFDDRVGSVPTGALLWDRIDEGYFEKLPLVYNPSVSSSTPPAATDLCADFSYASTYTDEAGKLVTDLAVTMVDSSGNKITDVTTQTPAKVTCFAASGNFLNWASASKFDIQKQILTGGKYYAGYESQNADGSIDNTVTADSADDRIVSEHRGCAGLGFTKQVTLAAGSDNILGTADDIKLTLRIRGSDSEDWLDTTDNTTRLEILALTVGGYNSAACQAVVDAIIAGDSFNSISNLINTCLAGASDDERAALNHGLQYCEALRSKDTDRDLNTIIGDCMTVYSTPTGDVSPATIQPEQGSYMCAGVFDDTLLHSDRKDYMGRCWTVPSSLTCWQKACRQACTSAPCYYEDGGVAYMCAADGFEYQCDGNFNAIQQTCNKPWVAVYEGCADPTDPLCPGPYVSCTPSGSDTAGWSDDIDGVPGGPDGVFADGACHYGTAAEGVDCECIGQAMYDYCQDMSVPEVIDPSDAVSSTIDYLGLPGNLVDSGVMSQLGVKHPLATYKGYLKYEPDTGDSIDKPDGPKGVLYDVADDLRLGVMAFVDNGSRSECDKLEATCTISPTGGFTVCDNDPASADCAYCESHQSIDKFCPKNNGDGARLITNIAQGMFKEDPNDTPANPADDIENWSHFNAMIKGINDVRATAWTPLAEAMLNAIAYYGQKRDLRLSYLQAQADAVTETSKDFWTEDDVSDWSSTTSYLLGDVAKYGGYYYQATENVIGGNAPGTSGSSWSLLDGVDPVQYWCQDNHVLIITEGASTADVNQHVVDFVNNAAIADTDANADTACDNGLEGSTYLDDLTYFANKSPAADLYKADQLGDPLEDKQNITTHIVTTGSLRDDGTTSECNPETIMIEAASNGGTSLYRGENPDQLEANLRAALSDILNRASAGSAASVISSSRSGEGAVYQALFWPEVDRSLTEDPLTWVGDVHSLYIDSNGRMWDDYSNNGTGSHVGAFWTEDKNGNGRLDTDEDLDTDGKLDGDRRVFFFFDGTETKICFNDSVVPGTTHYAPDADGNPVCNASLTDYYWDNTGTKFTEPVSLKDFDNYLWSANKQLEKLDRLNLPANRPASTSGRVVEGNLLINHGAWDWASSATPKQRYIFTWNDLNGNGIVDSDGSGNATDEIIELVSEDSSGTMDWTKYTGTHLLNDFNMADSVDGSDEMNEFITWFRGLDEIPEPAIGTTDGSYNDFNGNGRQDYKYRCRKYPNCLYDDDGNPDTALVPTADPEWRLGDVIHSTPSLVAQPAEAFHTIYRDPSYAWFVKKYRYRRSVVYFGANDGMFHAVNSGFYSEDDAKFYRGREWDPVNGIATYTDSGPELGDELWSYVPYNLQPHLKSLADPDYIHRYFVDQKPRVFDMQIFKQEQACTDTADPNDGPYSADCVHPGGWGTIVVGAMRFGGSPVVPAVENGKSPSESCFAGNWDPNDDRRFSSAYFILDITDPERPPRLLGEMTMREGIEPDMGYTTPMPTGVVMRDDATGANGKTTWYLIFGNGPMDLAGRNGQRGKIAVLPVEWLDGTLTWSGTPAIPIDIDTTSRKAFRIPDAEPGAASGSMGGRFLIPDIPISVPSSFIGDMMTVDFDVATKYSNVSVGAPYKSDGVYFGTVDGEDFLDYGPLSDFAGGTHWQGGGRLFRLVTKELDINGDQQVLEPPAWHLEMMLDAEAPITAMPSVGWDGDSFWIYAGTGRFYDKMDKSDYTQNRFFGLREPIQDCDKEMTWGPILLSELQRVDAIRVEEYENDEAPLSCRDYMPSCLPSGVGKFGELRDYIAGTGCDTTTQTATGKGGWYRHFVDEDGIFDVSNRERNLGQATLLGGLVTFTTYQPYADLCKAEGVSYLYGVHFQTGTAWHENVFGLYGPDGEYVQDKMKVGGGLATTPSLHSGQDTKAIIQSSDGNLKEIVEDNLPLEPPKSGKQSWSDSCN